MGGCGETKISCVWMLVEESRKRKMKLLKNVLFLPFCLKNWEEQFFNQFVPSFLFFFFLIVLHEYPNGKKLFLNYIYFKFLKYFLRAKHDLKRVSSP